MPGRALPPGARTPDTLKGPRWPRRRGDSPPPPRPSLRRVARPLPPRRGDGEAAIALRLPGRPQFRRGPGCLGFAVARFRANDTARRSLWAPRASPPESPGSPPPIRGRPAGVGVRAPRPNPAPPKPPPGRPLGPRPPPRAPHARPPLLRAPRLRNSSASAAGSALAAARPAGRATLGPAALGPRSCGRKGKGAGTGGQRGAAGRTRGVCTSLAGQPATHSCLRPQVSTGGRAPELGHLRDPGLGTLPSAGPGVRGGGREGGRCSRWRRAGGRPRSWARCPRPRSRAEAALGTGRAVGTVAILQSSVGGSRTNGRKPRPDPAPLENQGPAGCRLRALGGNRSLKEGVRAVPPGGHPAVPPPRVRPAVSPQRLPWDPTRTRAGHNGGDEGPPASRGPDSEGRWANAAPEEKQDQPLRRSQRGTGWAFRPRASSTISRPWNSHPVLAPTARGVQSCARWARRPGRRRRSLPGWVLTGRCLAGSALR